LFLNVYAPPSSVAADLLPVLFYIHGGGYGFGDNRDNVTELMKDDGGFIAVSIQYRVCVMVRDFERDSESNIRCSWVPSVSSLQTKSEKMES